MYLGAAIGVEGLQGLFLLIISIVVTDWDETGVGRAWVNGHLFPPFFWLLDLKTMTMVTSIGSLLALTGFVHPMVSDFSLWFRQFQYNSLLLEQPDDQELNSGIRTDLVSCIQPRQHQPRSACLCGICMPVQTYTNVKIQVNADALSCAVGSPSHVQIEQNSQ